MIFSAGNIADPYPVYEKLRKSGPISYDKELGGWLVPDHKLVVQILKDSRFSSDRVSAARKKLQDESLQPVYDTLALLMLQRDPPDHERLRNLVHHAFERTAVDHYATRIADLTDALLEPHIASGKIEFVGDFAVPLPILVISEILGIPEADRKRVKNWCDAFSIVALNFYTRISDEQMRDGLHAIEAFSAYLNVLIDQRRKNPGDDLLSALVTARYEGHQLTHDELVANTLLLLNAGNETTTCLLVSAMRELLIHPDKLAELQNHPELIDTAVNEFLRLQSPVQFIGRVASEDIEIGTVTVREGDLVIVLLGAANRDSQAFPRPTALELDRHPNHHVAFGHGHHLCAGVQLARLEARIALQTLLSRISRFEAVNDVASLTNYRSNFNLRCLETLHLRIQAK